MNPLLMSWRGLPLWAKLVTIPFILSGIASALYLITVVVIGIFGMVAALYNGVSNAFMRTKRSVSVRRGPQVIEQQPGA